MTEDEAKRKWPSGEIMNMDRRYYYSRRLMIAGVLVADIEKLQLIPKTDISIWPCPPLYGVKLTLRLLG